MDNISVSVKTPVRFKDLDLSFLPNPVTGDLRTKVDAAAVGQAIRRLVMTRVMESPFQPVKGTTITNLLFNLNSPFIKLEMTELVRYVIAAYEPRATFRGLQVTGSPEANAISLRIFYSVTGSGEAFVDVNLRRTR